MSELGEVCAVVGGAFGSEGKGVIVNSIADDFQIHVRVGGPNAGHSFYHNGVPFKMQAVPCGWTNPDAFLVIGRGALVNPRILKEELDWLAVVDPFIRTRLFVDARAGVLDDRFHEEEGGIHGEIHQRIGSTGEGVGAARAARMNRDPGNFRLFGDAAPEFDMQDLVTDDTVRMLNSAILGGTKVLLEGTQGSGLSLIHGPWPYVTSADTNAATLAADAGIPPHWISRVLMVTRTYPIRVAGNSGPLTNETTWTDISDKMGRPTQERTTVTKLVRRIGEWDEKLFKRSCMLNAPHEIALTFADYLNPRDEGKTEWDDLSTKVTDFVDYVERLPMSARVRYIGTGGPGWQVIDRGPK